MKLRILDKTFFNYHKICPTKALYSFNMDFALSDGKKTTKKDKTAEVYEYGLIGKILGVSIFTLESTSKLTYGDFRLILKTELNKALGDTENIILETTETTTDVLTPKQKVIAKIDETLSNEIYNMINPSDFQNVDYRFIRDYFELNDVLNKPSESYFTMGTNYKFKKKYFYEYEIPFITTNGGQSTIIKFTNTGIPNLFEEFDYDLAISVFKAKEIFPAKVFNRVVTYDLKSLKRTSFNINEIRFEYLISDLFKKFFIVDSSMYYKNFGDHCLKCMNCSCCYSELFKEETFSKIFKGNIVGKKLNELEKRKTIRNIIKRHSNKSTIMGV